MNRPTIQLLQGIDQTGAPITVYPITTAGCITDLDNAIYGVSGISNQVGASIESAIFNFEQGYDSTGNEIQLIPYNVDNQYFSTFDRLFRLLQSQKVCNVSVRAHILLPVSYYIDHYSGNNYSAGISYRFSLQAGTYVDVNIYISLTNDTVSGVTIDVCGTKVTVPEM